MAAPQSHAWRCTVLPCNAAIPPFPPLPATRVASWAFGCGSVLTRHGCYLLVSSIPPSMLHPLVSQHFQRIKAAKVKTAYADVSRAYEAAGLGRDRDLSHVWVYTIRPGTAAPPPQANKEQPSSPPAAASMASALSHLRATMAPAMAGASEEEEEEEAWGKQRLEAIHQRLAESTRVSFPNA